MLLHVTTGWLRAPARLWRAGAWSCSVHTHGQSWLGQSWVGNVQHSAVILARCWRKVVCDGITACAATKLVQPVDAAMKQALCIGCI